MHIKAIIKPINKAINSDWLWHGVILSVIPLVLVFALYVLSGHKIEEIDFVPDLILVSFAVAVNLSSCATSSKLKNEDFGKFCIRMSILSMILCFAGYYFLVGIAISLSEELLKLEILAEENPETLTAIASDIKSFLNGKLDSTPWIAYILASVAIIIFNASFGLSIEKKEAVKNAEDYEQISSDVKRFLKEKKNELNEEDYEKILADIKKFLHGEKMIIGATQLLSEHTDGMNPDSYEGMAEKAEQIIMKKGGKTNG